MEKKLVYLFSDGADYNDIVLEDLNECVALIEADIYGLSEEDTRNRRYTIQPTFMTQMKYNNLPEAE